MRECRVEVARLERELLELKYTMRAKELASKGVDVREHYTSSVMGLPRTKKQAYSFYKKQSAELELRLSMLEEKAILTLCK